MAMPTLRTWRVARGGPKTGWFSPLLEQTLPLEANDPLAAQLDHFCDVTGDHARPFDTPLDALQSLRVVDAVRLSIATRQAVALHALT